MPLEEFVHSEGRALEAEPGDGDQGGPISWSKTPSCCETQKGGAGN